MRWLDPLESRAWLALVRAHSALLERLDGELREEHDLTLAEYEVLAFLSEAPDQSMRMSDLAGQVLLSPSALTRRVDRMASRGLVSRRACPSDGRVTYAVLTARGRRLLVRAAPTHVRGVRAHFVDRLTRVQLRHLADGLERVSEPAGDESGPADARTPVSGAAG